MAEDQEMAYRARRLDYQRPHARASPRRRGTEPKKTAVPTGRGAGWVAAWKNEEVVVRETSAVICKSGRAGQGTTEGSGSTGAGGWGGKRGRTKRW